MLFCAAFLGLMIFVFMACRNEFTIEHSAEAISPISEEIQNAKQWFNVELEKTHATFFASETMQGIIEPLWEQAKKNGNNVETPFFIQKQMLFPTLGEGLSRFGISRLVVSKKSGVSHAYVFLMYPSKDFKGDLRKLEATKFQDQKFDGIIRVLNLKGEIVDVVQVINGKIAKKLKEQIVGRDGIASREFCYMTITYACGAVCVGGYCGEVTCSTKTIGYECGTDPGNGGGGNGDCTGSDCDCYPWIPDCNGTGNTGCTDPNPCVCDPNRAECGCPEKTGLYGTYQVGTIQQLFGNINVTSRMTNVSLKTGTHTINQNQYSYQPLVGTSYSFSEANGVFDNTFEVSSCTRKIEVGYWGNYTITEQITVGASIVQTTTSYPWGDFHYDWTFN